jgi:thioredoxin reductase
MRSTDRQTASGAGAGFHPVIQHRRLLRKQRPGEVAVLLETSTPGVFAAGDVRHGSVKRVASAVGEGSIAATQMYQYLDKQAQGA